MLKFYICIIFCQHFWRIMYSYYSKYEHSKNTFKSYKNCMNEYHFEKNELNALPNYNCL